MPSRLGSKRLVIESAPAVVILVPWNLLAMVGDGTVALGARIAGVVMALLYVVVRAAALSEPFAADSLPETPLGQLRGNEGVLFAAGVWVLSAVVLESVQISVVGLPEPAVDVARSLLVFPLAGGVVVTALLYAAAVGLALVRQSDVTDTGSPTDGDPG